MAKPTLSYLSMEELESIHLASTRILQRIGVTFPNRRALDLFREGGASVDYETSVVKIPPKMVEDALQKVPREIHLYARDPKYDIHVTDITQRWPIFGLMAGTVFVLDMETKKRRPATTKDLADCNTILDACENLEFHEPIISPQNVPLEVTWQHAYNISAKTCSKHVTLTVESLDITQDIIKMAIAVSGGEKKFRERPLLSIILLTIPPLKNDPGAVASVLEAVKYGLQIRVSAGTMAGASSPVTLAGCLAQANAEALAWMVLVQLANPGNPFVLGMNPRIMDMRYGTVSLSSPEWAIMRACIGDIGRYYNIQTQAYQMVVPSKLVDAQAGYEKTLTGLMSALGGINLAMGFVMDSQTQSCAADIVFSNEIVGAIRRILRGFEVNEETLAVDLIEEVGRNGNFVGTEHTLKHYREHWQPILLERRSWGEWHNDGEKDLWDRCVEKTHQILAKHRVEPLSEDVCRELDEIVNAAERRIGKR
jgi:trimethylamine--corrinoid protein Co-methyltransferase